MLSTFKRYIHNPNFIPPEVKELVILGNNSILFTTLSVLKQFNRSSYPKITWIYPKFWLDRVHADYMHLNWGQTIYGLPKDIRTRFLLSRPNYPDTKYIEWNEYQKSRAEALTELTRFDNIDFHAGEPLSIQQNGKGYGIVIDVNGQSKTVNVSNQSYFYNWYRSPKKIPGVAVSHISIYETPRTEISDTIIVLGHGLSIVWLLKHFPHTKIVNIKRKHEELRPLPSDSEVDIDVEIKKGRYIVYLNDEIQIRLDSSGKNAIILSHADTILHEAPIYTATGFVPNHDLISNNIPADRVLTMPAFSSSGKLLMPQDSHSEQLLNDKFVSPRNTPTGSLVHSYVHLMEVTKNMLWTTEPMFFHKKSSYELFKSEAEKVGIELTLKFFDKLDDEISQLDNALNPESAKELYLKIFITVCQGTSVEIKIFRDFLNKYFNFDNSVSRTEQPEPTRTFKP